MNTVELTRTQAFVYALLAVLAGVALTFTGQWLYGETAATKVSDGTQVVEGTSKNYDDDPGDLAYECAPGYRAVQLAVGDTHDEGTGSTFGLSEIRDQDGGQVTVTFTAKLTPNMSLPSVIINTAAHVKMPHIYGNDKIAPKMIGGSTTQTLNTASYTDNLWDEGITDVVFCIQQSQG